MKTQILQQNDSMLFVADDVLDLGTNAVGCEHDGLVQPLLQVVAHRREAILCKLLSLRTSEVRSQHDLFRPVEDVADRRQRAVDAMRLADLAVIDRHVEVDTDEYGFAAEFQVAQFAHHDISRSVILYY